MKLSQLSVFLFSSLLLQACGNKNFEGIKYVKINAQLSGEDGILTTNQAFDANLKIEGMGKFDVISNDNDSSCDAYVFHERFDQEDIPIVYISGEIEKEVSSDSYGVIKSFWGMSEGQYVSNDLGRTCTSTKVAFSDVSTIKYGLKLSTTEEVCETYCGTKVKTYCEQGCSTQNFFYSGTNTSSCYSACTVEENNYCKPKCEKKKFLVAEASVYGNEVSSMLFGVPNSESTDAEKGPLRSVTQDGDTLTLDVELKLEPYSPLNY